MGTTPVQFPHLGINSNNGSPGRNLFDQLPGSFDQTRYEGGTTTVKILSIPWESDYSNVVRFKNEEERDSWIDENTAYTYTSENRRAVIDTYRAPLPYTTAVAYNYIVIELEPLAATGDYIPYAQDDSAVLKFFYFITSATEIASNCTEYSLSLDIWQTYIYRTELTDIVCERTTATLALAATPEEFLKNPCNNLEFISTPDLDFGTSDSTTSTLVDYLNLSPENENNAYYCLATTADLSSKHEKYGSNNSIYLYTSSNTTPSVNFYVIEPGNFSKAIEALFSEYPQLISDVKAFYILRRDLVNVTSTVSIAGYSWGICSSEPIELDLHSLSVDDFTTIPEECKSFTKLYQSPYSFLNVTLPWNSTPVRINIENINGNKISVRGKISLQIPEFNFNSYIADEGESVNVSYYQTNLDTLKLTSQYFETFNEAAIPCYVIYEPSKHYYDWANYWTRISDKDTAEVAYKNAVESADLTYKNALVNAELAYNNTNAKALAAYLNACDSATTAQTNTKNSASTTQTNAKNSATTAQSNTDASASTAQTNAKNSASTAQSNTNDSASTTKSNATESAETELTNETNSATTQKSNANASASTENTNAKNTASTTKTNADNSASTAQTNTNASASTEQTNSYNSANNMLDNQDVADALATFLGLSQEALGTTIASLQNTKLVRDVAADLQNMKVTTATTLTDLALSNTSANAHGLQSAFSSGISSIAQIATGNIAGGIASAIGTVVDYAMTVGEATATYNTSVSNVSEIADSNYSVAQTKRDNALTYSSSSTSNSTSNNIVNIEQQVEANDATTTNNSDLIKTNASNAYSTQTANSSRTYSTDTGNNSRTYSTSTTNADNVKSTADANALRTYNTTVENAGNSYDTSVANATRTYNTAVSNAKNTYNTAVENAGNTYTTTTANSKRTYTTSVENAGNTYNTTVENAGNSYNTSVKNALRTYEAATDTAEDIYTAAKSTSKDSYDTALTIAKRNYDLALEKIDNTLAQQETEPPKEYGLENRATLSSTEPCVYTISVVTENEEALKQVAQYWKRYGYSYNGTKLNPSNYENYIPDGLDYYCYWKLYSLGVMGQIPTIANKTISFIFKNGVTVWDHPEHIHSNTML